jgi:hypothetical protein
MPQIHRFEGVYTTVARSRSLRRCSRFALSVPLLPGGLSQHRRLSGLTRGFVECLQLNIADCGCAWCVINISNMLCSLLQEDVDFTRNKKPRNCRASIECLIILNRALISACCSSGCNRNRSQAPAAARCQTRSSWKLPARPSCTGS